MVYNIYINRNFKTEKELQFWRIKPNYNFTIIEYFSHSF